ncbi:TlpA family protein disulfide reductase [Pararhodobacter sp. SW119]|uniref:TlpA family protein disulfide reductase n=1 Tax=Pararhodobacter sp. SW119 TaxID=2780075 RepID=UPI001ADF6891|nr:TlpA family protein disulfide reductase [Pararhodobacter sp. SW119]
MSAVTIGPFVLGIDRAAALGGIAIFLLVAEVLGRRMGGAAGAALRSWAVQIVLFGGIAARLGHVATYWDAYADAPWRVLAIWQGGFSGQWAAGAVLLVTILAMNRARAMLKPGLLALVLGIVAWQGVLWQAGPLPRTLVSEQRFETLTGPDFALSDHAGRPIVLNLWATWCPPCRRELPMMAEVAAENAGITFAFASQREAPQRVAQYLVMERIDLPNVVLDLNGDLGRHYGSLGLPTTVFIGANGKLVSLHVGEIARERLEAEVARLLAD